MTIQQMKDAIVNVYKTPSWRKKVETMYDDQVIAIYHDFLHRGKLGKVLKNARPKKIDEVEPTCQQLSIFDYINEKEEFKTL